MNTEDRLHQAELLTPFEGVIFLDDVADRAHQHLVRGGGSWATLLRKDQPARFRSGCVHDAEMIAELLASNALEGKTVYPYQATVYTSRQEHEVVLASPLTLEEVRERAKRAD